jgi:hypothetical protein
MLICSALVGSEHGNLFGTIKHTSAHNSSIEYSRVTDIHGPAGSEETFIPAPILAIYSIIC